MNVRSWLYFIARLLGDVNAVKRGQVKRRLYNRGMGKLLGRLFK